MRVTPGSINIKVNADLQRSLAALGRQQGLISAGRRITEPSDDPGGAAEALAIRSRQAANDQFQKNIAEARSSLTAADSVLQSIVEAVTHGKELAIQGGNDSNDASARQAIAGEVDQLLEALVALGNSKGPRGAQLFGGQESTVAPYAVTRDPLTNLITAVTPNPRGIDGPTPAEVSEGLTISTTVSGTTVFGAPADPANAFAMLITLRDALRANDGVATRATLAGLDTALDRSTLASTVVGTRLSWMDTLDTRAQDEGLVLSKSLSRVEDLDYAKAISDLNQIQTSYSAGLAAGARLLQQSLLDFLR
jgi:flagellar hook-associated protein 3 FlgL